MTQIHILLIDDEHIVSKQLEHQLSEAGFRITRSNIDTTAPLISDYDNVDVLITDIQKPGTAEGITVAALMRQAHPRLPVIFLSNDLNGVANSGRVAPPSAFLVKPVTVADVISAITKLQARSGKLIHERPASTDRGLDARPTGLPTDDRHAMETAHVWEDEEQPGSLHEQVTQREKKDHH